MHDVDYGAPGGDDMVLLDSMSMMDWSQAILCFVKSRMCVIDGASDRATHSACPLH